MGAAICKELIDITFDDIINFYEAQENEQI